MSQKACFYAHKDNTFKENIGWTLFLLTFIYIKLPILCIERR